MRRKRHDTRDTLGVSGTAILLPQRIQMILTHAGKPHCDCWTLRLDLPALRERLIGKGYTSEVVDDVIEKTDKGFN